jgi:hypothetical protein
MELHELRNSVELALEMVHDTRTVLAAEVCASWCEQQVVRLRHDTERPSEDVQALQAHRLWHQLPCGPGRRQWTDRWVWGDGEELSREGIPMALEMARHGAAPEPLRFTFPAASGLEPPPTPLHDPQLLTLPDGEIKQVALDSLDVALSTLQDAGYVRVCVSGEVGARRVAGHWQYAGRGQRYHHGPAGTMSCSWRHRRVRVQGTRGDSTGVILRPMRQG